MPSSIEIGTPVSVKLLKGFYHIWPWWPSWLCDLDYLNTLRFPYSIDVSHKIWL